jgi:uncharacterized RDD family membrane protein YckC
MGAIVPRALDAIDPDDLIERVDLDAALARMDLDALLARIDLQDLLDRIDIDALIRRVDVDSLVQEVDVDALIQRVDVDALMGRVDVDALMGRVDVNAMLDRVDLPALVARAGIDQIVRDATTGIATRSLDLARRQVLGIDVVALGLVDRVLRRRPLDRGSAARPAGSGDDPLRPAGPLARSLAFLLDSLTVSASFGLLVALGATLVGLFAGRPVDLGDGGPGYIAAFLVWWFLYLWIAGSIAGRTVGKAVVGLQIVALDGGRVRPARAALRAVVLPVSLVFGLGLVPAVVGRSRRTLHDRAAGTRVVVEWGGRDVALPGLLNEWIEDRAVPEQRTISP